MTGRDLTRKQLDDLRAAVSPHRAFLDRLVQRMEARGFVPKDPIYAAALRACKACGDMQSAIYDAGVNGAGEPHRTVD